jgi:hypothetical protein
MAIDQGRAFEAAVVKAIGDQDFLLLDKAEVRQLAADGDRSFSRKCVRRH